MTTPLEKIAEEKNGNYQSSLKGGGGGTPYWYKTNIFPVFSFEGIPKLKLNKKKITEETSCLIYCNCCFRYFYVFCCTAMPMPSPTYNNNVIKKINKGLT